MKNKSRNHDKQRQKAALKATRRRASMKPKTKPAAPKSFLLTGSALDFWRAHGANYILSDAETGTWAPAFDLYGGAGTKPPDLNEAAKVVMDLYAGHKSDQWPPEGRAALGWVVSSPETLTIYHMEALRRMKEVHPEDNPEHPLLEELVLEPHSPVVWGVFNSLKTQLAKRTA